MGKNMQLGKVIGTVTATRKEQRLEGFKLLIVHTLKIDLSPTYTYLVAVDTVGAGYGEIILLVSGSSARQSDVTNGKPVDAAVVGIIDSVNILPDFAESAGLQPGEVFIRDRREAL
jgi:microcompartment protein CcmK/EutM